MEKTKGRKGAPMPEETAAPAVSLIPENEHPDFVAGRFSDAEDIGTNEFTPNPEGPTPGPLPGPLPFPDPLPFPIPLPEPRPPGHSRFRDR